MKKCTLGKEKLLIWLPSYILKMPAIPVIVFFVYFTLWLLVVFDLYSFLFPFQSGFKFNPFLTLFASQNLLSFFLFSVHLNWFPLPLSFPLSSHLSSLPDPPVRPSPPEKSRPPRISTEHDIARYKKTKYKCLHQGWARQPSRNKRIPRADKRARDSPTSTIRGPTKTPN